jgi:molybdopterin synthase sulfur carrier subunit
MNVEIRSFAMLQEAIGERSIRTEVASDATIGSVLRSLEEEYPDLQGVVLEPEGGPTDSITVLRNGRHIDHFEGVETTLEPGDTISIMPPLAGGCDGTKLER